LPDDYIKYIFYVNSCAARPRVYHISMRIIAHLDMDAFFASIEERDHPRFAVRAREDGSRCGKIIL
jgi:hypothetical protein